MTAQEVSFEQFGRANITPFSNGHGTIAVAVSGGSDSIALLAWAHKYARASRHELLILTINHGLREASHAETQWVSELAKTLGHRTRILRWSDPIGQQDAARTARHELLAVAAKAGGAETVLLGHTFDDVVETLLMRHKRNRHSNRLAGPLFVSPSPVWPAGRGITICRPLLWQRRAHLRDELRQIGWDWRDDPSNMSPKYERNRIRGFLHRHPKTKARLASSVERALQERHAFDGGVAAWLRAKDTVTIGTDALVRVVWDGDTSKTVLAALGLLIRIASGTDRSPRAHALEISLDKLRSKGDRTTLAGAWLQRASDTLLIGRDPGVSSRAASDQLWDGRFEATSETLLPATSHILVRDSLPPAPTWREILSERLDFETDLMLKAGRAQPDVEVLKRPVSFEAAPLPEHPRQSEAPV